MKDKFNLYAMSLHQVYFDSETGMNIIRVPGGWIYQNIQEYAQVFVPYHDEFHPDPVRRLESYE